MKKIICNRVLPFCLVIIIAFSSLPIRANAVGVGDESSLDLDSVSAWSSHISNPIADFVNVIAQRFGCDPTAQYVYWHVIDGILGSLGVGEIGYDELVILCNQLNSWFIGNPVSDLYSDAIDKSLVYASKTLSACMGLGNVRFEVVQPSPTAGFYRIQDSVSGLWLVNSKGQYPCAEIAPEGAESGGNQWVAYDTLYQLITAESARLRKMDYTALASLHAMLVQAGVDCKLTTVSSKYRAICTGDGEMVYCDSNGYPFVCDVNTGEWASNQERPDTSVTDENGEEIDGLPEDNVTNIDLSGMTITLPDGSINMIDNIYYDESTKSYHIDSHDTYNTTNNYYYEWNYYINYTSITYIGQTEEYNKYYEVYYELPDGRDSADLTSEEVEQLNVSVDVIPYSRCADDTSLRSLYHFDGDTRDSSYWNYYTDFTWNDGASLTYMDAGVFDGALYLDENEHDFTITLPGSIGYGDFTLQFRYYQSYTATPSTDSYILFEPTSSYYPLQLDGANMKLDDGSVLDTVSVGQWNEIAIIRYDEVGYWYLNGVLVGSDSELGDVPLGEAVTFHFGSAQQTYKYLDELRILNYALVANGAAYEPTAVPYDSNLSLVLPDSEIPVADEYWEFTSSKENLLSNDIADWSSGSAPSGLTALNLSSDSYYEILAEVEDYLFPVWGYRPSYNEFYSGMNSTAIYTASNNSVTKTPYLDYGDESDLYLRNGIFSSLSADYGYIKSSLYETGKTYTLSMVAADGSIGSVSYTIGDSISGAFNSSDYVITFNGYRMGFVADYCGNPVMIVQPASAGALNYFMYLELVEGDSTDLKAEKISTVVGIDRDSLNTPTLAVRTDLEITSYQIGGVRPSLPTKGQVWAMVENERIVSIQIYNGQAWEAVDGRIWTGSRWIPASSYNIITLQDMYDIVDATQDFEYIYSESGFWTWWQKSWNAFTERLFGLLETIANPAPSTETVRVEKTITWDGNSEGLELLDGVGYKVSDEILYAPQLVGGVVMDSSGNEFILDSSVIQSNSEFLVFPLDSAGNILGLPVVVLYVPDPISDTETCSPGVYFYGDGSNYVASLTYYVEATVVDSGGTGGSGTSIAPSSVKDAVAQALSSLIQGVFGVITELLKSLIGLITDLLSFLGGFLTETIFGGVSDFFSTISDGSLLEGFEQSDESGNSSTGLPEGVPAVFAFFSGLFLLMPAELRLIMMFGIGLMLLLAVFKLVKS